MRSLLAPQRLAGAAHIVRSAGCQSQQARPATPAAAAATAAARPQRIRRRLAALCAVSLSDSPASPLGWATGFAARFTLGPELGRGSFGTVFRACDKATKKVMAVKVLSKRPGAPSPGGSPGGSCSGIAPTSAVVPAPTADASEDDSWAPARLAALEAEVSAFASVQASPYVARLEGLYMDADCAYLVQELLEGGTLGQLLAARGGRLPEAEAAAVMRGVLDVLETCHARGIVHGDVKPENFMIEASGAVRAVDFGSSRPVPLAPTDVRGTPLYMAPELGQGRCGTAVDLWSAGVLLYVLLTGRLPFWTNMSRQEIATLPPWTVLAAVRTHLIEFPRTTWRGLSVEAQDLVASLLTRNPAERPTAAEALAHPWFAMQAAGAAVAAAAA